MKQAIFLILMTIVNLSFAADFASVTKLKGKVTINGKTATIKSLIKDKDLIAVDEKSFIKLKATDNTLIIVGPKSQLKVDLSSKKIPVEIIGGSLRWISPGPKKVYLGVKSKNAVLGVRGTDFYVEKNNIFNETQMVCFSGEVLMINSKDRTDKKTVKSGQWGGIGGRYSQRIGEIIDLSPEIIKSFKDLLD